MKVTISPSRLIAGLIVLTVCLMAILCAAVLTVGLRLSAPAPSNVGPPPQSLPGAEAVEIPSVSGSRLRGWWVPGALSGRGTVILIHGLRANRLQMTPRARVLRERGFSVLLFDLQAHGESDGRRITFGKLESQDAAAAVRFVRDRRPGERVAVIGVSLGGAAALLGPDPLPVDALVLESVFPDIDAALSNRLRVNLGRVAGAIFTPILTPAFELLLPPILGAAPRDLRPVDHVGMAGIPVLIASGTLDRYTPLNEARDLFAHAAEPKLFWAVNGAAHVDLEQYDPTAYWDVVLPFLTRYLDQADRSNNGAAPQQGVNSRSVPR